MRPTTYLSNSRAGSAVSCCGTQDDVRQCYERGDRAGTHQQAASTTAKRRAFVGLLIVILGLGSLAFLSAAVIGLAIFLRGQWTQLGGRK